MSKNGLVVDGEGWFIPECSRVALAQPRATWFLLPLSRGRPEDVEVASSELEARVGGVNLRGGDGPDRRRSCAIPADRDRARRCRVPERVRVNAKRAPDLAGTGAGTACPVARGMIRSCRRWSSTRRWLRQRAVHGDEEPVLPLPSRATCGSRGARARGGRAELGPPAPHFTIRRSAGAPRLRRSRRFARWSP